MKQKYLPLILAALSMGLLVLDSAHVVYYASEGIDLCIKTVIPSLFPFFLLSIYLTGNVSAGSGILPVLVSGFLGGYPAGAQAAAESCRTGRLCMEDGNRMLMFCSQAGPAFLFGMVMRQFPETKYIWLLWGVQILSALSVAFLFPVAAHKQTPQESHTAVTLAGAMQRAIRAMASVCGWVVVFRVVIGYLSFLPLGKTAAVFLSGILELANGCLKLGSVESLPVRFLLAAVMLNFGGICVLLQTASVIPGLALRYYLSGKLLQTAFAVLYSLCLLGQYLFLIPIFLIFLLLRRRIPGKNSSNQALVGV